MKGRTASVCMLLVLISGCATNVPPTPGPPLVSTQPQQFPAVFPVPAGDSFGLLAINFSATQGLSNPNGKSYGLVANTSDLGPNSFIQLTAHSVDAGHLVWMTTSSESNGVPIAVSATSKSTEPTVVFILGIHAPRGGTVRIDRWTSPDLRVAETTTVGNWTAKGPAEVSYFLASSAPDGVRVESFGVDQQGIMTPAAAPVLGGDIRLAVDHKQGGRALDLLIVAAQPFVGSGTLAVQYETPGGSNTSSTSFAKAGPGGGFSSVIAGGEHSGQSKLDVEVRTASALAGLILMDVTMRYDLSSLGLDEPSRFGAGGLAEFPPI